MAATSFRITDIAYAESFVIVRRMNAKTGTGEWEMAHVSPYRNGTGGKDFGSPVGRKC